MAVHFYAHFFVIALLTLLFLLSCFTRADITNRFLYPPLNASPPNVQAGDRIKVSSVSDWSLPIVTVWCGDATTIQRDLVQTIHHVSETGSNVFVVASYWVDSCVFELVHPESVNTTYFTSGEISIVNEERSPLTWGNGIQLFDRSYPTSSFGTSTAPFSSGISSRSSATSFGASSVAIIELLPSSATSPTSSVVSSTSSIAASPSRTSVSGIVIATDILTAQAPPIITSPTSISLPLTSIPMPSASAVIPCPARAYSTIWQKVAMALAISMGVLLAAGLGWYIPRRQAKIVAERKERDCGIMVVDPWWYDDPQTTKTETPGTWERNDGRYELDGTPRIEIEEYTSRKGDWSQRSQRSQTTRGLGLEGT